MTVLVDRGENNAVGLTRRTGLRIGIDATCWQNNRGYGRHIRALLRALIALDQENDYTLFLDSPELLEPLPEGCRSRFLSTSRPTSLAASASGRRSVADMWQICRAMSHGRFDLLFFPTIYSYVPTFTRARKLVMIHDVIAETYPQLTVPNTAARLFWNLKVRLGRMQADGLITVSSYSRRRIVERFGITPDRVFVVGEASDPVFRRLQDPALSPRLQALGLTRERRTVVYVGGFSPHKNIDLLVRAFARCATHERFSDLQLVLVGEYRKETFHSHYNYIATLVAELGVQDRTVFTGYLPDEELVGLLNLGSVLVLPSLMEGFGLPAIEAAACGCPVIATEESPLPELLREAGVFIPPRQEDLNCALQEVLDSNELRARMQEAGLRAAGRLSWNSAARQMLHVIESVSIK